MWFLRLPGLLHLLRSCSMISERPLLLATRDRLAGTMLGEAIVVVRPPGKHDELRVCKRLQREALPGGRCCVSMREH